MHPDNSTNSRRNSRLISNHIENIYFPLFVGALWPAVLCRSGFSGYLADIWDIHEGMHAVMLHTENDLKEFLDDDDRAFMLVRTRARIEEYAFTDDYHVVKVIGNKAIISSRPDSWSMPHRTGTR